MNLEVDHLDDAERAALDNPVWSALTTVQAPFALGDGLARRFLPDVGPFAGLREDTPAAWRDLRGLLNEGDVAALLGMAPPDASALHAEHLGAILQMFAPADASATFDRLVELGIDDASDMRRLARLTKPGPFGPRTHELGAFLGVRENGALVAMAGERMRVGRCVEISGVCVHPDRRGAGHAARLTMTVAARIAARGGVAFLHVFEHNTNAKALYERLGFRTRRAFDLHRVELA